MSMNCRYCEGPEHSGSCDREQLKRVIDGLRESNRILHLEKAASQKLEGKGVIMIRSLISHRTHAPRVDMQVGEVHTQMDVAAAMDVAKNLIEVSMGSFADGFIVNFLQDKLNQPIEVAAQILDDFRGYREELQREFEKDQDPEYLEPSPLSCNPAREKEQSCDRLFQPGSDVLEWLVQTKRGLDRKKGVPDDEQ